MHFPKGIHCFPTRAFYVSEVHNRHNREMESHMSFDGRTSVRLFLNTEEPDRQLWLSLSQFLSYGMPEAQSG